MQKQDHKVGAQINLIKLPSNTKFDFDFDQSTDWVRNILIEMNEKATDRTPEEHLQETFLKIQGHVEKKNKPELGEYLLVKGTISAEYDTECVRTLQPMAMEMDLAFQVCFIDESLATTEMFEDTDETWLDNEVYELYFYNKRTINFLEMLHEQIFLNYDQYPVLDAESELEGVVSVDDQKA